MTDRRMYVAMVAGLSLVIALLVPFATSTRAVAAAADVACPSTTVGATGPTPAAGTQVPGSPACFKITIPHPNGVPTVLSALDASSTVHSGDALSVADVPIGSTVSGMYWTLITQGGAGAYWTAGTSYRLQSYGTNLCLQAQKGSLVLASCATTPAIFNITARDDGSQQLETGVFGVANQCLAAGLASAVFTTCNPQSANQGWSFSGPLGWLLSEQLGAAAAACPQGESASAIGCAFAPKEDAAGRAVVKNVQQTDTCATDQLGNQLEFDHAPTQEPVDGGNYSFTHTITGEITTTSTYSSSLSHAFTFNTGITIAQAVGLHKQTGITSAPGSGDDSNIIDIKDTTTTTLFSFDTTTTGTVSSSYSLATGGSTSVAAQIGGIPPGDFAWFSVVSTFVAADGNIVVPDPSGNYEIPVPNYYLPVVPTDSASTPADASQVPIVLSAGSPGPGSILEGHVSTSSATVSSTDCVPPAPVVQPGPAEFHNVASELALSAQTTACASTASNAAFQFPFAGSPDQNVSATSNADGSYTLTNGCNLVLTDPNSSTVLGTQLTFAANSGGANQRWKVDALNGSTMWVLKNMASNLVASAQSTATGSNIVLAQPDTADTAVPGGFTEGPSEQWALDWNPTVPPNPPSRPGTNQVQPGDYQLIDAGTQQYLSSAGDDCATNNQPLVQSGWNQAPDQIWTVAVGTDTAGNATYSLTSKCGKALTDPNSAKTDPTQLTQATSLSGSPSQQWQLAPVPGTTYFTVVSRASNLAASVTGQASGAQVQQQSLHSTAGGLPYPTSLQEWTLQSYTGPCCSGGPQPAFTAGAPYQIENAASGLSIGTLNASCGNNLGLIQTTFNDSADQTWTLSPNADGTYTLTNECVRALTDPNSTSPGVQLTDKTGTGQANQRWYVARIDNTDRWTIRSASSNEYAEAPSSTVLSNVVENPADGDPTNALTPTGSNEQWTITAAPPLPAPTSGSTFEISNAASGLAIGASGNCGVGTGLTQTAYTGQGDQAWTVTSNGDGTYTLVNSCPLTMDDPNTSIAPGRPLTQTATGAGANVHWMFVPVISSGENTTWEIVSGASQEYVTGGSGSGAAVTRSAADGGGLDQQWVLTPVTAPGQVNTRPVASAVQVVTSQDVAKQIALVGSPANSNSTYTIVAGPSDGSLSAIGSVGGSAVVTYTPVVGYSGSDSFTYTVTAPASAGGLTSLPATVGVSVALVAPVAVPPPGVVTSQDVSLQGIQLGGLAADSASFIDGYSLVSATTAQGGTLVNFDSVHGTVTYQPKVGFPDATSAVSDTFQFVVVDSRGALSSPATVTITVSPTAPSVVSSAASTNQDTPLPIQLKATSLDYPVASYAVTSLSDSSAGTLNVTNNDGPLTGFTSGELTFVPTTGYSGTVSFQYSATDQRGLRSTPATITITVNPTGPTALPFTRSVLQGQQLPIQLTSSSDLKYSVSYLLLGAPSASQGQLSSVGAANSGAYVFTANGTPQTTAYSVQVKFQAKDSRGVAGTPAYLTLTVYPGGSGGPNAPTAASSNLSTLQDVGLSFVLGGVPGLGARVVSFVVVQGVPSVDGSLSLVNAGDGSLGGGFGSGAVMFTPAAGFSGTATFEFEVVDSDGLTSLPATVSITVGAVAPSARAQSVSVAQDGVVTVTLSGVPSDAAHPVVSYSVVGMSNGTLKTGSGTVKATGSPAQFAYQPDAGFPTSMQGGLDQFQFTVTDDRGLVSVSASVTVTVSSVAPTATTQSVSVPAGSAGSITLSGVGADSKTLVTGYALVGAVGGTVTTAQGGTVRLQNSSTGAVIYTPRIGFPATNAPVSDQFQFTATDDRGVSSTPATVMITVTPQGPYATAQSLSFAQDVAASAFTLTGSDPDSTVLATSMTYTIVSSPVHGTLGGSGAARTYKPTVGYAGPDSFTFTMKDKNGVSLAATVSITVTPQPPTAKSQPALTTKQNTPLTITLTATAVDASNPITAYTITSSTLSGTLTPTATLGKYTYQPNSTFPTNSPSGADSFQFTATDQHGRPSAPATVTITVTATAPTATAQSVTVTKGSTLVPITLTATSLDPITTYTITATTTASSGTVTLKGGATLTSTTTPGTWNYTPRTTTYTGPDTFTFTVTNTTTKTSTPATITITVK